MESNGSTKPVQFGLFEKLYPRIGFKDMTQYISKLLSLAELGQVIIFPYNPGAHWVLLAIDMVRRTTYYLDPLEGSPDEELMQIVNKGIRIHQSLNYDTKANVQWIPVKFKGVEEYTLKDLSRLRDQWATYVAKLITAYNRELENGEDLTLHCKSKDNDLGEHVLHEDESYNFSFCQNVLGETLFFCTFEWSGQVHKFDIFDGSRDPCSHCNWRITHLAPCRDRCYKYD
ncbi:hypothetical protein WN943_029449 [Citrus x changshan-huyou]